MYVCIKLSFFCKERKGEDDNEPGASKHIPNHPTTPTFQAQLSALSESSHPAQYCISQGKHPKVRKTLQYVTRICELTQAEEGAPALGRS
jgi:hypothetical protein